MGAPEFVVSLAEQQVAWDPHLWHLKKRKSYGIEALTLWGLC
jgi:hypothetical protein